LGQEISKLAGAENLGPEKFQNWLGPRISGRESSELAVAVKLGPEKVQNWLWLRSSGQRNFRIGGG
tara:strand:+ start:3890 stop:4087 length:198 start_codon:yes stop_codon:yes gene_type:complete